METCSEGCTLAKDQVIYLCACVEVGRLSWYISALSTNFQTSETVHYVFLCLLRLSQDLQTFLNVVMYADLFIGMYTIQGSGDILVRMCGSWENLVVHLRTFRRIFKQVKQCIMSFYAFCASHTTCRLF